MHTHQITWWTMERIGFTVALTGLGLLELMRMLT